MLANIPLTISWYIYFSHASLTASMHEIEVLRINIMVNPSSQHVLKMMCCLIRVTVVKGQLIKIPVPFKFSCLYLSFSIWLEDEFSGEGSYR